MGYRAFCCFPVSGDLKFRLLFFFLRGGGVVVFRIYMIGIVYIYIYMYIYIYIYIYKKTKVSIYPFRMIEPSFIRAHKHPIPHCMSVLPSNSKPECQSFRGSSLSFCRYQRNLRGLVFRV